MRLWKMFAWLGSREPVSLLAAWLAVGLAMAFVQPRGALAEAPPVFLLKWGTPGTGDGQFLGAGGLACGAAGPVYVSDPELQRVQRFTRDGAFVLKWDDPNSSATFGGMDIDGSGNVYLQSEGQVKKYDGNGVLLESFHVGVTGDVAVDDAGQYVYVVGANVVFQYTTTGTFLRYWTTNMGTFASNNGVAVGPSGNVYVVEGGAVHRVYKYTWDGVFIVQWGGFGSADGMLDRPFGVDVDADENVYVTEVGNSRVQKFTSDGVHLTKWGSAGTGDGQFLYPTDVVVDEDGNVYVVDHTLNTVQKFGEVVTPVVRRTWGQVKARYREAGPNPKRMQR